MAQIDYERAGVLALVAAILLPFKPEFRRRSSLLHESFAQRGLVLLGMLAIACGFILFLTLKSSAYPNEQLWTFASDAHVPRALRAGLVGAVALTSIVLATLLRALRVRSTAPDAVAIAAARHIIATSPSPEARFALIRDKSLFFSDDGAAFIMYAMQGRSWMALGGPIGPALSAQEVALAFADAARTAGARPVFYESSSSSLPLMLDLGLNLFKMGEEAVVDLTRFSLEGPSVRNCAPATGAVAQISFRSGVLFP